jgi:hypothetical protein
MQCIASALSTMLRLQARTCKEDATCKQCRRDYYTASLSNLCDAVATAADLLSYQKYWSDKAGVTCDDAHTQELLSAEAKCMADALLKLNSGDKIDSSTQKLVPNICSTQKDKKVDDTKSSGTASTSTSFVNIVSAICVGLVTLLL